MENKKLNWGVPEWIVVAGVLIIVSVLVLIDAKNLGSMQSIVVIISAVAAAVVTYLLLQGQKHDLDKQRKQDKEDEDNRREKDQKWEDERRKKDQLWQDERREKDLLFEQQRSLEEAKRSKDARIYSNKIAAFSAFNKAVWQENMDTRDDDKNTIINIRKELFSRVILYLSSREIDLITAILSTVQDKDFPYILSSIVNILNRNADNTLAGNNDKIEDNDDAYQKSCNALWNSFNAWLDSLNDSSIGAEAPSITPKDHTKKLKSDIQTWHFCMWSGKQLESLRNGLNELSLVEYGEYWRTDLVKKVNKGDILFLFRGNKRYAGAFLANGWRVFEYDADRNVKEITSHGIEKSVVPGEKVSISSVEEKLRLYDIYESFKNPDSTSCANVIVEPISFPESGVPNPNTTYRKTISRYYPGYAVNLLNEFIEADPGSEERINQFFE